MWMFKIFIFYALLGIFTTWGLGVRGWPARNQENSTEGYEPCEKWLYKINFIHIQQTFHNIKMHGKRIVLASLTKRFHLLAYLARQNKVRVSQDLKIPFIILFMFSISRRYLNSIDSAVKASGRMH